MVVLDGETSTTFWRGVLEDQDWEGLIMTKMERSYFIKAKEAGDLGHKLTPDMVSGFQSYLQVDSVRQFLEEGTALDARFKSKVSDEGWYRLEEELI